MTTELVMSQDIGKQLCEAWGLDSQQVIQMDIVIGSFGEPATIRVLSMLAPDQMRTITEMLREYRLVDKVAGDDRT